MLAQLNSAGEQMASKSRNIPATPDAQTRKRVHDLESHPRVVAALELLHQRADEITDLQVEFARLPSPDHRATQRARLLERLLQEAGLSRVRGDAAGNVIATLPGADRRSVLMSAHLDTVFPDLEKIEIEREGGVLRGPGVADDAAGLAAIVHVARALREAEVPLHHDLVVVGTVGEEGEGDLRGVKHLFEAEYPREQVVAFLTLDLGAHESIVHAGLGSRRLRVTLEGPGGHSWGDFGRPNPIHALSRGLARFLERVPRPRNGGSSYNVGTIEGGRGVNVIPEHASVRVDLRSESIQDLTTLELALHEALKAGVELERDWSRADAEALKLRVEVIGDRPVGVTDPDSPVMRAAVAAFAACDLRARLSRSSTDANVPMSLGIPALALPHGAHTLNAHSMQEWCDVRGRQPVLDAVLLTVVALSGASGPG
jgi:acetylornithine deacetylase/succinyl-diaminopimelate desuccinylase-like protein